eukprot:9101510-Lingulodinium_polyedra.AAC.1
MPPGAPAPSTTPRDPKVSPWRVPRAATARPARARQHASAPKPFLCRCPLRWTILCPLPPAQKRSK